MGPDGIRVALGFWPVVPNLWIPEGLPIALSPLSLGMGSVGEGKLRQKTPEARPLVQGDLTLLGVG